MKYDEIKTRVSAMIGERVEIIRKDAANTGYEIQVVCENSNWISTNWINNNKTIKIIIENGKLVEVVDDNKELKSGPEYMAEIPTD